MITNEMLNPKVLTIDEAETLRATAREHLDKGTTFPMLNSWCAEYRPRLNATIDYARNRDDRILGGAAIAANFALAELHERG